MKTPTFALALVVAAATACPAPKPPTPPQPTSFRLQIYVHDASDQPLVNARAYRDNVASENPNKGGTPFALGSDAGAAWVLPPQGFNICGLMAGYTTECAAVPLSQNLTVTVKLNKLPDPPPPPPPPPTPAWTRAQLTDLQSDLMIWAPDVGCQSDETRIKCDARGLQNGWVWSLTTPRYGAANRQKLYADAKKMGFTHYAIDVNKCEIGDGYHGLLPVTTCDGFDEAINVTLRELWAQNLIPVCAGITDKDAPGPGIDRKLCPVVMDDWDNTHQKDCHVKALAQTFPDALIYIEMPQGKNPDGKWAPGPDSCSPVPFPSGGGEWIRNLQRQYPNFVGVLYEVTLPDGVDVALSDLQNWNPWFRDLQQVVFETDTYWKFWENLNVDAQKVLNDQLRAKATWTHGYFSGGTSHAAPTPTPTTDGHYEGELNANDVQMVNAPDFRSWPQTTSLDSVEFTTNCLDVRFDKQATWPDVSFGIQFSLGLCEKIGGTWYCSAPIELWKGLTCSGGQVQAQHVDGTTPGQIARNWFYDGRWGAMNAYQPAVNEQIGVFVVSGDARNNVSDPKERSNIVLVRLPAENSTAKYVK